MGHDEVDAKSLLANPKNWRINPKNQVDALAGVLAEVGWVQDVIVNKASGFVVDGQGNTSCGVVCVVTLGPLDASSVRFSRV